MKTLILNGSPRKNGDTAGLLKIFRDNMPGEIKIIDAYYCGVSPCVDCRWCWKHNGCAIQDEMQEIYRYIQECDNVLIASPVYFSELTGKLLDLGSRLQTYFCAKYFRGETPVPKAKRSAVLLVGGGKGSMEKACDTAQILLRDINAGESFPPVCWHGSDEAPPARQPEMLQSIKEICRFFQRNAAK